MFKWGFGKRKKLTPMSSFTFPVQEKVYCKKCKYFRRKLNDFYYMNRERIWDLEYTVQKSEPNNPIPVGCGQQEHKWHVECMHPENHKEHVEYIDCFDEVEERRYKNVRSPRGINYSNDCHWFKKIEDEPDWEK
jgi:hypothetical protein